MGARQHAPPYVPVASFSAILATVSREHRHPRIEPSFEVKGRKPARESEPIDADAYWWTEKQPTWKDLWFGARDPRTGKRPYLRDPRSFRFASPKPKQTRAPWRCIAPKAYDSFASAFP
jgi:hypothetical protein